MKILPFLLLALSIFLETGKNVFSNNFSKRMLLNETDIYKFNTFMYICSFLVLCCTKKNGISLFTVVTALFFAIAIWLNQYFFLKALTLGDMGFTNFIQGSALVIPIVYGAFVWNEIIRIRQILLLVLLIASLALALGVKKEKLNIKWLLYSIVAMIFVGVIGILQSTHQMSSHKEELTTFLCLAFLFTFIINGVGWVIMNKKTPSSFSLKSNAIPMAAFCGVFMGIVHLLNLYLAGAMKKIIFFPVVNGGLIFVTLIAGLIFFKERLDKTQWIGIIIGTVALSLIGL